MSNGNKIDKSARPKAVIILSEGRSGSSYLGAQITAARVFGNSSEWLDIRPPSKSTSMESFYKLVEAVEEKGCAENGNFTIKIFPRHIFHINRKYGVDYLDYISQKYDVFYIFLERKDRIGQAISFARAKQSQKWESRNKSNNEEYYDFNLINNLLFTICESYTFWRQYLEIKNINHQHLYYEDMLQSNETYRMCFDFIGKDYVEAPATEMKIQRDNKTQEWREKFLKDAIKENVIASHRWNRPAKKDALNIIRMFNGKPIKPYGYTY